MEHKKPVFPMTANGELNDFMRKYSASSKSDEYSDLS